MCHRILPSRKEKEVQRPAAAETASIACGSSLQVQGAWVEQGPGPGIGNICNIHNIFKFPRKFKDTQRAKHETHNFKTIFKN